MTKLLIVFFTGLFITFNSLCTELNLIKNGTFAKESQYWIFGKGWSKVPKKGIKGSPCAKLKYDIKNKYSQLFQSIQLEPNSYYKLIFYYHSNKLDDKNNLLLKTKSGTTLIPQWTPFKLRQKWTKGTFYFYSGKINKIRFGWYLQAKKSNILFMDNISVIKIKDIGLVGKNFIVNSNFEDDKNGWFSPKTYGKKQVTGISSNDSFIACLDGEKSLKLDTKKCLSSKKSCAAIYSNLFSFLPNKKYLLTFWAKSRKLDIPLVIILDSWIAPFIPPHWYKMKTVMIDTTFRKYQIEFDIPSIKEEPALIRRLLFLKIVLEKVPANVWIDNIKFAIKK